MHERRELKFLNDVISDRTLNIIINTLKKGLFFFNILTFISGQLDVILEPQVLVPKLNVEKSKAKLQAKLEYNLLELMNTELEGIKSAKTKPEKIECMSSFDFFAKHLINIKNISSGSIFWSLVFYICQISGCILE